MKTKSEQELERSRVLELGLKARNLNPGNLRRGGKRFIGELPSQGGFRRFDHLEMGVRAAEVTLNTYFGVYGIRNIEAMITRWAPPTDGNDTEGYIEHVMKMLRFSKMNGWGRIVGARSPRDKMTVREYEAVRPVILAAIFRMETGGDWRETDVVEKLSVAKFLIETKMTE